MVHRQHVRYGILLRKGPCDKTLGLDRNAKFIQPENMRKEMMYDYMNIEKNGPPGAEGANQGNGKANQYLDTSAPYSCLRIASFLPKSRRY